MTARKNEKACLIYPENKYKGIWDLFMTFVLLFTCILTPYTIAFVADEPPSLVITNATIDVLFLIDMCFMFLSVYYDEEMKLIDDRKRIAENYLKGWFTIDLLAIIPFDVILNSTDLSSMVRVVRVGRLYKLVKLTRLIRVLKIMKEKSKLLKYLNQFLKLGLGFERLFFLLLVFFMVCHISSCLWVMIAAFQAEDFEGTWAHKYYDDKENSLYMTSFYWTITTITTVGYGDISGTNDIEKLFCSLMMLFGVIAFSFANGSLASIISNYD